MAYNASNNVEEELGSFLLNNRGTKEIRVKKVIKQDTGEISYDIRNYFMSDSTDEMIADKRGVRLSAAMMADVMKLIQADMKEEAPEDTASDN